MNLLDILLVVIIAGSVFAGLKSGFARVGIGFIAVICGMLFGFWFYGTPAAWIYDHLVHNEAGANLLGFLAAFVAFVTGGALVGNLLAKLFKWTGLSWLDRFLGGAFGLVRGALVSIVFVAVLMAFTHNPLPNWMIDSKLLPYAVDASKAVAALAPHSIKSAFQESLDEIHRLWEEQLKKKKPKHDLEPRKADC